MWPQIIRYSFSTKKTLFSSHPLGRHRCIACMPDCVQLGSGQFGRTRLLLDFKASFARAELGQTGRKMACNEYIGGSLDSINMG